jgi:hypothetical protein
MQSQELPVVVHNVSSFDHFRTTDSCALQICCCAESGAVLQVMSISENMLVSLHSNELQIRYPNLRGAQSGSELEPLPCYLHL